MLFLFSRNLTKYPGKDLEIPMHDGDLTSISMVIANKQGT